MNLFGYNLISTYKSLLKNFHPGRVAQLIGALSHTPKGCRVDSWSGHIPASQVQSLVGVHMGDN